MKFREGDKVEFVYRNKKSVGEINGVFPETQVLSIKQSDSPVDLLFSDKAVAKVEEPELVVVPQCVADWYEKNKYDLEYSIWKYIRNWDYHEEDGFFNFMNDNDNESIKTLIKMQNGYEVEKEPLYWIQLIEGVSGYLNVRNDGIQFINSRGQTAELKTRFTESEIKAMDKGGAYWQFAVLVEEVEGEQA
ncbi:DUF1642 domain-containing protein [Listeria monocytogenes]|nr:DUF1642 domain-containing protein [Listeria monocytogenes]